MSGVVEWLNPFKEVLTLVAGAVIWGARTAIQKGGKDENYQQMRKDVAQNCTDIKWLTEKQSSMQSRIAEQAIMLEHADNNIIDIKGRITKLDEVHTMVAEIRGKMSGWKP